MKLVEKPEGISSGETRNLLRKRAGIYLSTLFGGVLVGWILTIALPAQSGEAAYSILISIFSFIPVLAVLLTRILTKDSSPWLLRPKFRGNWKTYLTAAFVPSLLMALGAVLYFLLFPEQLDLSAERLVATYGSFGVPADLPHTLAALMRVGIIGILISPFAIPIVLFALGEEIGWRGYLLPIFLQLMDTRKAIVLTSILWGLGHAPLIYLGFNYGLDYPGAPFTGIVMMVIVCLVLGIWLSQVTISTQSVIPAAILHGALNLVGEWPALVAFVGFNPLLGPNPTGIIGLSGLAVGAVFILIQIRKRAEE
jgi:membrane protease YdiL (CAAX protease family)